MNAFEARRRTGSTRFVLRPKADQDLDQQAYYLATEAGPETGHRFLVAARETFALLSTQPQTGLASSSTEPEGGGSVGVSGFEKMLVLYSPVSSGIEIVRVIHGSRHLVAFLRRERL